MKRTVLLLLKFYKRFISPALPSQCRFTPTCSVYAYQAIESFGLIRGGLMAVYRVLRCNPFNKGGFDPVPINFRGKAKWVL